MNARHALIASGLMVAGWLAFFGDKTPEGDIAEPATPASASRDGEQNPAVAESGKSARGGLVLALARRDDLIDDASDVKRSMQEDSGQGETLFAGRTWELSARQTRDELPALPPGSPAATSLPFTYFGKKFDANRWEVFLASGDQVFIAQEKTIIDGAYRIDSITPLTLTITYLPLRQVHTLNIGGTD